MSYLVLARKWRPRAFEDLVGQSHVVRALCNALASKRLHHAYLFTGTRGVGKTTAARILAKCLNCEAGINPKPCGACASCLEIDQGRYIDLLEVDAASRTKVEETRDLLDNVQYAPTRGRFKVYLIDEVHMFSNHSFNALLKTLEEPPPHVKFLLATTDPKKLPVTILSRCLQFNLKPLAPTQIEHQIERILTAEGIESDRESRQLIAKAAEGSLRDGLSLLDQAIAFGNGILQAQEVSALLGIIGREWIWQLLERIVAGDGAGILKLTEQIEDTSPNYFAVLGEILAELQRVAIVQMVPELAGDADGESGRTVKLAADLSPEQCQLLYQIALIGRRDLAYNPDLAGGFEMVLLRMLAFQQPEEAFSASIEQTPSKRQAQEEAGEIRSTREEDWQQVIEQLKVSGLVRELAENCVLARRDGKAFHLRLSPRYLRSATIEARLQQALQQRFGADVRLVIVSEETNGIETPTAKKTREVGERQQAAERAIEQDLNVRRLGELFGAEVIRGSVRPAGDPEP
ncbi:MAG: DNA polymerase III subunit gamma/tau [Gammaproteobacteria bacterium]